MGVEINISGNNIGGNAKVLNDLKVSGNSQVNVKIKDTNIRDQAKVLNNREVKDGKLNVNIENLNIDKDVEFMSDENVEYVNRKKANNNTTTKQNVSKSKKKGLFGKLLSLFKEKNEEDTIVYSSQEAHRTFENQMSNGGKLKNMDTSEAVRNVEQAGRNYRKPSRER